MTQSSEYLRKAAIVVSSLSAQDADSLLDQMPPQQASLVRQAVMDLDEISAAEERTVLAEFLGIPDEADVQLELSPSAYEQQSLAEDEESKRTDAKRAEARALLEEIAGKTNHQPFEFLANAEAAALVKFLDHEHPQTIALVLSHLPAETAAEVVVQFPSATQVDVLRRVAHLDQTNPEILAQVSREVEQQLRDRFMLLDNESSGVATVQAIMDAANSQGRNHLLSNVGKSDPHLAKRIRPESPQQHRAGARRQPTPRPSRSRPGTPTPANRSPKTNDNRVEKRKNSVPANHEPTIQFQQLNTLLEREWQMIVQSVNRETLLVALAGADETLVNKVLKKLPYHQAESLRQSVNDIGPLRLSDVEYAQQRIVKAAIRLSEKGELNLPAPTRFAAAV